VSTAVRTAAPPAVRAPGSGAARVTAATFTLASFAGSSLLFLVQPMVGRLLLPRAGGTVSLWNTAMVFFQAVLLVGYLLAHLGTSRLGVRRHRWFHLALLGAPLAFLPLQVPAGWALDAGTNPVTATLDVLGVMVGVPFLALATSSPTLQRWFAATNHPNAANPYFLYAAGNVGSMASLLAYPLVIERTMGLRTQTTVFAGLYLAFLALTAACAVLVPRPTSATMAQAAPVGASSSTVPWSRRTQWVALAFVPSALLLGTTRFLTTDIASFPLLWVLPLVLYLLSFIVAFGGRDAAATARRASRVVVLGAVPLALGFTGRVPVVVALVLHLGWLFAAALLGHARLSADRPEASRLTEFYSWVSLGGVLGGGFTALGAPVLFTRVWEYPLAIVATVALARGRTARWGHPAGWVAAAAGVAAGAALLGRGEVQLATAALAVVLLIAYSWRPAALAIALAAVMAVGTAVVPEAVLYRDRSFFGTYAVLEAADGTRLLQMGTTVHGSQRPDRAGQPTTYYHPDGPLGDLFAGDREPLAAGLIGLGAGEIAAYGRPGDHFAYYEIDPVVVRIAQDPALFTYLRDTRAEVEVVVGDGRLALAASADRYDVVVVDAFSSDAIPVHLLTEEALTTYLAHVGEQGLVVLHVSNRHFELAPVVGRLAAELGVSAAGQRYQPDAAAVATGATPSTWVALSASAAAIAALGSGWEPVAPSGPRWTDDYSNVLGVFDL
jgi:hypothetical protein